MIRVLLLAGVLLAVGALAAADSRTAPHEKIPHGQDRPPGPALSPAEAISRMRVPPGFSVELVAAEPDIVNPVAMTFDERGRGQKEDKKGTGANGTNLRR